MKRKTFFKKIIPGLLTVTALSIGGTLTCSAHYEKMTKNIQDTSELSVYTSEIPEKAYDYSEKIAPVLLSNVLDSPKDYGVTEEDVYDCTLGTPYTIPVINTDGSVSSSDIYNFPVLNNDKVILILSVYQTDNVWNASISKEYVNKFESLDSSDDYLIYSQTDGIYAESKDEKVILQESSLVESKENTSLKDTAKGKEKSSDSAASFDHLSYEEKIDTIETETGDDLHTVEVLSSSTDETIISEDSETSTAIKKSSNTISNSADSLSIKNESETSPLLKSSEVSLQSRGFVVNTQGQKFLDMNGCIVNQQDSSGRERGMCWAATVATIVRYFSGDRNLRAWNVCDTMGIDYDAGGSLQNMCDALEKYRVHGYRAKNSQSPWDEITNHIDNQVPLGIGAYAYSNGQVFGHAVTVTGYSNYVQNNQSYVLVNIWNSGNQQNQVMTYSTNGTQFPYNGFSFIWQGTIY